MKQTEESLKKAKAAVAARLSLEPRLSAAERTKLYEEFRELGRKQKKLRDDKWR